MISTPYIIALLNISVYFMNERSRETWPFSWLVTLQCSGLDNSAAIVGYMVGSLKQWISLLAVGSANPMILKRLDCFSKKLWYIFTTFSSFSLSLCLDVISRLFANMISDFDSNFYNYNIITTLSIKRRFYKRRTHDNIF